MILTILKGLKGLWQSLPSGRSRKAVVTRRFRSSAERVFDAWFDPVTAGRWMFATVSSNGLARVQIDARVGGTFQLVDRSNSGNSEDGNDGNDVEYTGVYHEIARPGRIVFTFWVPGSSTGTSRVLIDIVALGTGCELTLTQENVHPQYGSLAETGWNRVLGALATTIEDERETGCDGAVVARDREAAPAQLVRGNPTQSYATRMLLTRDPQAEPSLP